MQGAQPTVLTPWPPPGSGASSNAFGPAAAPQSGGGPCSLERIQLFLSPLSPLLTQAVVSVMGQVESIIAGTSVVARDVDTVVYTACVVLPFTLIHVCAQRERTPRGLRSMYKQLRRLAFTVSIMPF